MGLVERIEDVHEAFGELGTLKTEPVKILLRERTAIKSAHGPSCPFAHVAASKRRIAANGGELCDRSRD